MNAAERDVRSIVRRIAPDSERVAERFGTEFDAALERIGAFPETGRKLTVRRQPLRLTWVSSRFWRHLIVYRIDDDAIRIVRVLHGAMDIRRHLRKSDL